jgi:transcriptional regulator with XRE-family HTH domain
MSPISTTASILKRLRVQASLTQLQLGTRIGVTKASISAYEKGKAYPSLPILTKLAQEFNQSIDELRGGASPSRVAEPSAALLREPAPFQEVPYLPATGRAAFVAALGASGEATLACALLPPLAVPELPGGPVPAGALVAEVDDYALAPVLYPQARVLALPVPAAEWPFLPPGLYCLAYRTRFAIRRLKDNTLLQQGLLLLHADQPAGGGAYPVRAEDLRAVWQVQCAVYAPLL